MLVYFNEEQIKPYDYSSIKGEIFEDEIKEVDFIPRKNKPHKVIKFDPPIKISLKLSENKQLNRPPVFIVKGRRINTVKSIDEFQSNYGSKNMLWGHQQITGYIDLKDNFEPTLQRNSFVDIKKEKFKAFNQKMKSVEELIYKCFIEDKNKEKQNKSFKVIAEKISDIISKLASEDILHFREQNFAKNGKGRGYELEEGFGGKDKGTDRKIKTNQKRNFGFNEGTGVGVNLDQRGSGIFEDNTPNKKAGFSIDFTEEELIEGKDGENIRSEINEKPSGSKVIKIYRKHKEFESRLKKSKKGDITFTPRLIAYISHEIALHYQDEVFRKNRKDIKVYEKKILVDLATTVHKIETALSELGHVLEDDKKLNFL